MTRPRSRVGLCNTVTLLPSSQSRGPAPSLSLTALYSTGCCVKLYLGRPGSIMQTAPVTPLTLTRARSELLLFYIKLSSSAGSGPAVASLVEAPGSPETGDLCWPRVTEGGGRPGVVSQPGVTAPLNWTNYAANVAHSPSFTRFLYTMDGWMVHQTIDPTLANTSDLQNCSNTVRLTKSSSFTSGKEIHATICFGYLHYLLSLSHVCHWLLESPLMVHFTRRNVEKW